MKNTIWFPFVENIKANDILVNLEFDDFFDHAAVLAHTGQKFEYQQLGKGTYEGRLLYAPLGDVSIQVEYSSQSLEKSVEVKSDSFTFVMSGSDTGQYGLPTRANEPADWIQVFPPSAEHVAITPPDTTLTVIRVKKDSLLGNQALLPEVCQWLADLDRLPVLLNATSHANRLRSDIAVGLEILNSVDLLKYRSLLDIDLATSVASTLSQLWLLNWSFPSVKASRTRERFLSMRKLLLEVEPQLERFYAGATQQFGSKRLIQKVFSDQVNMSPLAYSKTIRLHNARRKFLDETLLFKSIGEIAAEEGFWEWSRFTTYYREQFGELPSETRAKSAR